MDAKLKVAEIYSRAGSVHLHVCFAESVVSSRFTLLPVKPFRRVWVETGPCEAMYCREDLQVGRLPTGRFCSEWVPWASWMDLSRDDLLWAVDVCRKLEGGE